MRVWMKRKMSQQNQLTKSTTTSDFETAVQSANILNVLPSIIDGMISKASNLLSTAGNVIPKPGATDGSYTVAGTANKVHSVTDSLSAALIPFLIPQSRTVSFKFYSLFIYNSLTIPFNINNLLNTRIPPFYNNVLVSDYK